MYFTKALLVAASFVATVAADSSRIAFTVLPSSIQAGQDVTLHWGGGDGSPVSLTLQQGTTQNLKTVLLVTGDATGDSYTWKVPTNLPSATNYALRIQQGDSDPNYTGMITLTGGSGSAAAASASSAAASSGTTVVSRPNSTMSNANSTMNSTMMPTMVGTAGSSAGTGTTMARNSTFSSATLTSTSSGAAASSNVGGSGGPPSSSSGTTTGSSTAPSKTGGAVTIVASNFALVVCAVAGIVLLG